MCTILDIINQIAPEYPSIEWHFNTSELTVDKCIRFSIQISRRYMFIFLHYSPQLWTNEVCITKHMLTTKNNRIALTEACEKLNRQLDVYRLCLL